MKKILLLFIAVACVITLCSCNAKPSENEETTAGMVIDINDGKTIRNGTETLTYQVEEGQTGKLVINLSKTSGKIDIVVTNTSRPDTPVYTHYDAGDCTDEVMLYDVGEYLVVITATDFEGDYAFDWSHIEETTVE